MADEGTGEQPVKTWRDWTLYEWTPALLRHYFSLASGDGPVTALVVVGEELARAAGEPQADPDEVETSLVQKVLRGVGDTPFWRHADSRRTFDPPAFVPHLFVACLAATDVDEQEEDSFIARLAELTEGRGGENNLELMPTLWEELAAWLADRPTEYRMLALPDPGGWTRVGHTVKLAFPSKRDQRSLLRQLDEAGLLVEDPPVGRVVHAINRARRGAFSRRFGEEFQQFRALLEAGAPLVELRESPFWSAVRAITDVEGGAGRENATAWTLLVSDDGYDVDLAIVTTGPADIVGVDVVELADPIDNWTFVAELDGSRAKAAEALLSGALSIPRLSTVVRGGLLPLVIGSHGELEAASRSALSDASCCLVRASMADSTVERFGSAKTRIRPSGIDSWTFVENVTLHEVDANDLEQTQLEGCLILERSLPVPTIRITGGVAVGRAWLGLRDLLPTVRATEADSVSATNGSHLQLEESSNGEFHFPRGDLDGVVELEAQLPTGPITRRAEFVMSPSAEGYKQPSRPDALVYEDLAHSRPFTSRHAPCEAVFEYEGDDSTIYLGRDVGEFALSEHDAAYAVVHFGQHQTIHVIAPDTDLEPTATIANAHLRRTWRKLLKESNTGLDRQLRARLDHIVSSSSQRSDLPRREPTHTPEPAESSTAAPHTRLDEAVAAFAAVGNARSGVDRRWATEVLTSILPLGYMSAQTVLRAWQEAELLDELVNVRWSGRRWIACPPRLVVHARPDGPRGVLRGLTLPTTIAELSRACAERGLPAAPVPSVSPFVPPSLAIQAETFDDLRAVTSRLDIPCAKLRTDPFDVDREHRELASPRPTLGYIDDNLLPAPDGVDLRRHWRKAAPGYWSVTSPSRTTWCHFEHGARFWAHAFADSIDTSPTACGFETAGFFLPLGAARWLSSLGQPLSGPTGRDADAPYCYTTPTKTMYDDFTSALARFAEGRLSRMNRTDGEGRTDA